MCPSAWLGAHHQEPGEVELGEEGALHGTELGAGQGAEPLLQALGGGSVAPCQEAPQLRGVADHGLQWEAGAHQGELVGRGLVTPQPLAPQAPGAGAVLTLTMRGLSRAPISSSTSAGGRDVLVRRNREKVSSSLR